MNLVAYGFDSRFTYSLHFFVTDQLSATMKFYSGKIESNSTAGLFIIAGVLFLICTITLTFFYLDSNDKVKGTTQRYSRVAVSRNATESIIQNISTLSSPNITYSFY